MRVLRKPLLLRLLSIVLGLMLAGSHVHAGVISTDEAVAMHERERLHALLERPEAAGQLEKMGIRQEDARARIRAMSDDEVRSLIGRLDRLPAGGQAGEPALGNPEVLMWILLIGLLLLIG
jgi:hypothetical protein